MSKEEIEQNAQDIKMIYNLLLGIPRETLKRVIEHIEQDIAIGPLLNPSAFQGDRFERNDRIIARAIKLLELRDLLEERKINIGGDKNVKGML